LIVSIINNYKLKIKNVKNVLNFPSFFLPKGGVPRVQRGGVVDIISNEPPLSLTYSFPLPSLEEEGGEIPKSRYVFLFRRHDPTRLP
jgi:hypothetical protein